MELQLFCCQGSSTCEVNVFKRSRDTSLNRVGLEFVKDFVDMNLSQVCSWCDSESPGMLCNQEYFDPIDPGEPGCSLAIEDPAAKQTSQSRLPKRMPLQRAIAIANCTQTCMCVNVGTRVGVCVRHWS